MTDQRKIIESIRPDVERDLKQVRAKADHYAVMVGIVFLGFFVFFLLISDPPPPLFSIFYLILGIVAYFGLRDQFLKLICPVIEDRLKRLEHEPESPEELAERAGIFAEYGQPEAAIADYREALEWAPDDTSIRYDFATLLWKLGRSDEALEFLEQIMPISSDYQAAAFFLRGRILEQRDPVLARQCFDRAIEIDPDAVEFFIGRAEFFLNGNQPDEAAADMEQASELYRRLALADSGELCKLRGILKMKRGDAAGALKDFSRAIRIDPPNASLYFRLRSEAYEALGDFHRARLDRRDAEEEP